MNFKELIEKYRTLQAENRQLKEKIHQLENLGGKKNKTESNEDYRITESYHKTENPDIPSGEMLTKAIDKQSSPAEKVELFSSIFRGREDVFATRWKNSEKGTSGYSPACGNEWVPGI